MAGPAEGPSAVEPRRHRVQLGPAPRTTDLRWPAGLQAAVDLRRLSLRRSHSRTLPPASQERLTSILVSDSREMGQTETQSGAKHTRAARAPKRRTAHQQSATGETQPYSVAVIAPEPLRRSKHQPGTRPTNSREQDGKGQMQERY